MSAKQVKETKRAVDFRYISDKLDFISKPDSVKDLESGNYDKLEASAKKYIDKFHLWHLMYRTEIVCFVIGFIVGAIIL